MSSPTLTSLGALAEFVNGDRGKNYPSGDAFVEDGIPFVSAADIANGGVDVSTAKQISREAFDRLGSGKTREGDVLFCLRGSLGKTGRVVGVAEAAIASSLVIVRAKQRTDPRFLYYLLRSSVIQGVTGALDNGSVQPNLSVREIAKIVVPDLRLPEQRAISHILGTLDDKIELNRRINETLEAMARALFKSWFVDFDPVRAKMVGAKNLSPLRKHIFDLFPDSFEDSELGEIPKGWRYCPLGELIDLTRGRTYKSSLKDIPGPVLLGLASIERNGGFRNDKLSTYGGDCPVKLLLGPGDLFASLKDVTQSADLLGAVARVPAYVKRGRLTQDTVKLNIKCVRTSRNILYSTLLTPEYRDYCRSHATGTTNLGLSRDDFLAYPILQPGEEVQAAFDTSIDNIEAHVSSATAESRTLAALRDTLLPKLLSGELRVKDAERFIGRHV